jgi:hypothetical protein
MLPFEPACERRCADDPLGRNADAPFDLSHFADRAAERIITLTQVQEPQTTPAAEVAALAVDHRAPHGDPHSSGTETTVATHRSCTACARRRRDNRVHRVRSEHDPPRRKPRRDRPGIDTGVRRIRDAATECPRASGLHNRDGSNVGFSWAQNH